MLLVDQQERIIGALVARPADSPDRESWETTIEDAWQVLEETREDIQWGTSHALPRPPGSFGKNRRGNYYTTSEGPSYGEGQKVSYFCFQNRLY